MKRYRLKKDLPTFKAGDIFRSEDSGSLVWHRSDNGESEYKSVVAYMCSTLNKFPDILTDWFEEITEESKTVWDLKEGDEYYMIDSFFSASNVVPIWTNSDIDKDVRELGNAFLTKEEAEKEIARRKAKQILLRDTKGFKLNIYNIDEKRYYVAYDPTGKNLDVYAEPYYGTSHTIIFATEEDAMDSVTTHEKEWKTYLGVEK